MRSRCRTRPRRPRRLVLVVHDRTTVTRRRAGAAGDGSRAAGSGGMLALVWPTDTDWLRSRGFTYESFDGEMCIDFGTTGERASSWRASPTRGRPTRSAAHGRRARVPYELIGINRAARHRVEGQREGRVRRAARDRDPRAAARRFAGAPRRPRRRPDDTRPRRVDVFAASGSRIDGASVVDTGIDPSLLEATFFRASEDVARLRHRARCVRARLRTRPGARVRRRAQSRVRRPGDRPRPGRASPSCIRSICRPSPRSPTRSPVRAHATRWSTVACVSEHGAAAWRALVPSTSSCATACPVASHPVLGRPPVTGLLFAGRFCAREGRRGGDRDRARSRRADHGGRRRVRRRVRARTDRPAPRTRRRHGPSAPSRARSCGGRWPAAARCSARSAGTSRSASWGPRRRPAGTPVVAFDRGAMREVVDDGRTGHPRADDVAGRRRGRAARSTRSIAPRCRDARRARPSRSERPSTRTRRSTKSLVQPRAAPPDGHGLAARPRRRRDRREPGDRPARARRSLAARRRSRRARRALAEKIAEVRAARVRGAKAASAIGGRDRRLGRGRTSSGSSPSADELGSLSVLVCAAGILEKGADRGHDDGRLGATRSPSTSPGRSCASRRAFRSMREHGGGRIVDDRLPVRCLRDGEVPGAWAPTTCRRTGSSVSPSRSPSRDESTASARCA